MGLDGGVPGGDLAQRLILAGGLLGVGKGEFELVDEPGRALGAMAVKRATHLRVLQLDQRVASLQVGDDRVRPGQLGIDRCGMREGLVSLPAERPRSEEHTSELQSLMRISYAVFCLKTNNTYTKHNNTNVT